jgi:hypothetical protein
LGLPPHPLSGGTSTNVCPAWRVGCYGVAVPVYQADIRGPRFRRFVPTPDQIHGLIQQFEAGHDRKITEHEIPLKPIAFKLFLIVFDQNDDGMIYVRNRSAAASEIQQHLARLGSGAFSFPNFPTKMPHYARILVENPLRDG